MKNRKKRIVTIRIFIGVSVLAWWTFWCLYPGLKSQEAVNSRMSVEPLTKKLTEGVHLPDNTFSSKPLKSMNVIKQLPLIASSTSEEMLGYESKYGELPDSLLNVEIPADIKLDSHGNLLISSEIRDVFEFFISGISEEARDIVINRIDEYLQHSLPTDPASEVAGILRDYVAYKDYLLENEEYLNVSELEYMDSPDEKISLLKDALEFRKEGRRKFMQEEVVNAFFREEEAYDDYSTKRIEIDQDKNLNNEEKIAQITSIEEMLPEQQREKLRRERASQEIKAKVRNLLSEGGNEDLIHKIRTEAFGSEVADRLAILDQQRLKI